MKNALYFDNLFECVLLVNEAREGNTIWLEVETDAHADQTLEILIGEELTTISLTSSTKNAVQLMPALWNLGGTTQVRLSNANYVSEYVVLKFPTVINTDSSLYYTSEGHYSMQGSFDVQQEIEDLHDTDQEQQIQLDDVTLKVLEFILPVRQRASGISDGSNSDVLEFELNTEISNAVAMFSSSLNFEVSTTYDSDTDTYHDCVVTVTFKLDGTTLGTMQETYGDGKKILTMNYSLPALGEGNHLFVVNLAPVGGSLT